jgi:predicted small lipoprotein YifL
MRKLLVMLVAGCALSALSACDRKSSLYLEPGQTARPSMAKPAAEPAASPRNAAPAMPTPTPASTPVRPQPPSTP